MAGESFAASRLRAMTGTSSATAGTGLSGADLAAGLMPGLPPLMACNTGLSLMGFTTALPADFADLLALGMSPSLLRYATGARLQCYGRGRYERRSRVSPFNSDS